MGEAKRRQSPMQTQAAHAMAVDTPGGRIHVQWDHEASATPNAQLAFYFRVSVHHGRLRDMGQEVPTISALLGTFAMGDDCAGLGLGPSVARSSVCNDSSQILGNSDCKLRGTHLIKTVYGTIRGLMQLKHLSGLSHMVDLSVKVLTTHSICPRNSRVLSSFGSSKNASGSPCSTIRPRSVKKM